MFLRPAVAEQPAQKFFSATGRESTCFSPLKNNQTLPSVVGTTWWLLIRGCGCWSSCVVQMPAGGAEAAESAELPLALSAHMQQMSRCCSHIDWLVFAVWKPSGHRDPTYWHDRDLQSRRGLEKILLDLKRSLHAGSSPVHLLQLLFS